MEEEERGQGEDEEEDEEEEKEEEEEKKEGEEEHLKRGRGNGRTGRGGGRGTGSVCRTSWDSPLSVLRLLQELDYVSAHQGDVSALPRLVGQLHPETAAIALQREKPTTNPQPTNQATRLKSKVSKKRSIIKNIEPHLSCTASNVLFSISFSFIFKP